MHARLLAALRVIAPALLAGPLVTAALTRAASFRAPTSTLAPEVAVVGVVFQDDDQDGERDPGELGLPGVRVSNGVQVLESGTDGAFALTVARDDSRFVLLTVPRGFRATAGFYHRVGAEAADSAAFGLAPDPAADTDRFRFVHASDPHVFDAATAAEFRTALDEMAAIADPAPAFAVVTGDLVNSGSVQQLGHAAGALSSPPLAVHAAFGDHDADADSLQVRTFESLIGPTYYSFDRGPYHFMVYNDVRSASLDGSFKQRTWLANDAAAAAAAGQIIYVFTHYQPDRAEFDVYRGLGVAAVYSGHWHSNRSGVVDGILSVNTGTLRMAGIDRSSRGFRLVELDQGTVRASVRTGGIAPRVVIVDPPAGTAPYGVVRIRAMAYGTSQPGLAARFTVLGSGGQVASGDLQPAGGWSFTGTWEAAGPERATFSLTVDLLTGEGGGGGAVLATSTSEVTLDHLLAPGGLSGAPWPRFRGDAGGSGRASADLVLPLHLGWSRHVGGPTELASPVIADGSRVFIAHAAPAVPGSGALVALDLTTGGELWRFPTGAAEVKGTPAVADGRVVILTSDGRVTAVEAASGTPVWSAQLGDPADRFDLTSPVIADGVVYAGGPEVVAALDAATGAVLWQRALGDDWLATIYSAPVCDETRVAFGLYPGLFVLDRSTGATLWSRSANGRETHRSPALVDGVLYAAGDTFGSQRLRALDAATGAELWSAPYPVGNSNSAPAVGDSAVLIGSGNGTLEAFARADGRALWGFAVGAPIASARPYARDVSTVTSSPLLAGDHAFVGADDGRLYAVDLATGASPWSADLGAPVRSSPAASGNILLVATADGTLFAFVSGEMAPASVGDPAPGGAPRLRTTMGPAWPNPFRAAGTIPFAVGGGSGDRVAASLRVYDVAGRAVRTLIEGPLDPGPHAVRWDARDAAGQPVASGVYFLRLTAGEAVATTRVNVVR